MDIVLSATGSKGVLRCGGEAYPCALGRSGVSADKKEGDGATPAGCFPLRRVFYRADKIKGLETTLPLLALDPSDGWCDDPADPLYNRPVRLPYGARCEALWRDDGLYDVVVVLGHNDDPAVAGRGSAIFLHAAKPGLAPTEGCIALKLPDLIEVLRTLHPGDRLCVEN